MKKLKKPLLTISLLNLVGINVNAITVVVKEGDNLSDILYRHGRKPIYGQNGKLTEAVNKNKIIDEDKIYPGQVIDIGDDPAFSPEEFNAELKKIENESINEPVVVKEEIISTSQETTNNNPNSDQLNLTPSVVEKTKELDLKVSDVTDEPIKETEEASPTVIEDTSVDEAVKVEQVKTENQTVDVITEKKEPLVTTTNVSLEITDNTTKYTDLKTSTQTNLGFGENKLSIEKESVYDNYTSGYSVFYEKMILAKNLRLNNTVREGDMDSIGGSVYLGKFLNGYNTKVEFGYKAFSSLFLDKDNRLHFGIENTPYISIGTETNQLYFDKVEFDVSYIIGREGENFEIKNGYDLNFKISEKLYNYNGLNFYGSFIYGHSRYKTNVLEQESNQLGISLDVDF